MSTYLIFGFAGSGKASLNLLYNKKDNFYIFDDSNIAREEYSDEFKYLHNIFALCSLDKEVLSNIDCIVLSPAVSIYDERIKSFKGKIISELELGFTKNKGKLIAITGTNGKTTTTKLVSHILNSAGKKNIPCGNIGLALSMVAKNCQIKVCEVSSFQLEAIDKFSPDIACILNITPDHIDRHKSFKCYEKTKYKILSNLTKKSFAILNSNLKLPKNLPCKVFTFGKEKDNACYTKDGYYYFKCNGKQEIICEESCSSLLGEFNKENIMCAIIVAKLFKVSNKIISHALQTFVPEKHRLELIYNDEFIKVYDDSKATNIDACLRAMQSFMGAKNIFLILGGSDKNSNFDLLFKNMQDNVSHIIAVGQVREKILSGIKKYSKKYKNTEISSFESLKEGVQYALSNMQKGILLLSPACASFDEFSSYKDRGEKFKEYVFSFFESNRKG